MYRLLDISPLFEIRTKLDNRLNFKKKLSIITIELPPSLPPTAKNLISAAEMHRTEKNKKQQKNKQQRRLIL